MLREGFSCLRRGQNATHVELKGIYHEGTWSILVTRTP
jgi:hypothetical protein